MKSKIGKYVIMAIFLLLSCIAIAQTSKPVERIRPNVPIKPHPGQRAMMNLDGNIAYYDTKSNPVADGMRILYNEKVNDNVYILADSNAPFQAKVHPQLIYPYLDPKKHKVVLAVGRPDANVVICLSCRITGPHNSGGTDVFVDSNSSWFDFVQVSEQKKSK